MKADIGLPSDLEAWLVDRADSLDGSDEAALEVVPRLGAAGLFRRAVPASLGGDDGRPSRVIASIAAVAEHSLAAAFAFWGQRVFIEFLVQGDNPGLRDRLLPALVEGRFAGASGLSNAMKYLSGIEAAGLRAEDGKLAGRVPWITNARRGGFVAAVAAEVGGSEVGGSEVGGSEAGRRDDPGRREGQLIVLALPHDRPGLVRSADLDLIGLRGTQTAALAIDALAFSDADVLAADGRRWLPRVRPAFLGFQCGLSVGLARAALAAATRLARDARPVLGPAIERLRGELATLYQTLADGVDEGRFITAPVPLFELRLALARAVDEAVRLELLASGGRAYSRDAGLGFARRWREAAFIPIVTPSLTQLEGELLRHRGPR